jgi:hypothetical protein
MCRMLPWKHTDLGVEQWCRRAALESLLLLLSARPRPHARPQTASPLPGDTLHFRHTYP